MALLKSEEALPKILCEGGTEKAGCSIIKPCLSSHESAENTSALSMALTGIQIDALLVTIQRVKYVFHQERLCARRHEEIGT